MTNGLRVKEWNGLGKSERYLKEIAKNTAEIAKELKRINRRENAQITVLPSSDDIEAIRQELAIADAIDEERKF